VLVSYVRVPVDENNWEPAVLWQQILLLPSAACPQLISLTLPLCGLYFPQFVWHVPLLAGPADGFQLLHRLWSYTNVSFLGVFPY
jgi:hypothetical protein